MGEPAGELVFGYEAARAGALVDSSLVDAAAGVVKGTDVLGVGVDVSVQVLAGGFKDTVIFGDPGSGGSFVVSVGLPVGGTAARGGDI